MIKNRVKSAQDPALTNRDTHLTGISGLTTTESHSSTISHLEEITFSPLISINRKNRIKLTNGAPLAPCANLAHLIADSSLKPTWLGAVEVALKVLNPECRTDTTIAAPKTIRGVVNIGAQEIPGVSRQLIVSK